MGRRYTAQFSGVAATAQQDLFELVAPSDAVVVVHEWGISNLSEVGDAAEEMLLLLVKSGQTTSGSGGSAVTPAPNEAGDPAFGGTVEANNTTKASAGTIVNHAPSLNWNVRQDREKVYTPETRLVLSPGRRMTIELATTPADSITLAGWITFEEFGG